MTKAGKALVALGALIALITVVAGVLLAVSGFGKLNTATDELKPIRMTQPSMFTVAPGDELVLYLTGSGAVVQPTCQVVDGPAPAEPGPAQNANTQLTINTNTYKPFDSFRFPQAGTYGIVCDGPGVVAGPPLALGGIFSGIGGALLAVFGGMGGGVILVIGIVLWVLGSKRSAAAA